MKIESDTKSGLNMGLMKSRKGFLPIIGTVVMVIGVLVVGFFALKGAGLIKGTELSIKDSTDSTQDRINNDVAQTGKITITPDTVKYDFIASNPLDVSGTVDYNAESVKVQADAGDAIESYTTDTDGTAASSSLELGYGPQYHAWVLATKNTSLSVGPVLMDSQKLPAKYTARLDVPLFDHPRISVYDNKERGDVWCTGDLSAAGATVDLNYARTCYSTTNSTAKALGNSESMDWTFTIDTAQYKTWGGVHNYIAVDRDATDYASSGLSFDGVALKEVSKSTVLNANDADALQAYEKLYELPVNIGESDSELRLKVETKATGTVDADMKVRFLTSVYRVNEAGTGIEEAIFNSAGTELAQDGPIEVTIDIS